MDQHTPPTRGETIAYLRVSTDTQDASNQWNEIVAWCVTHRLPYPIRYEETASTKMAWRERELADAVKSAQAGDTMVVAEVSRLARSTLEVLEIVNECLAKGVAVHIVKTAIVFDGSLGAKVTITILALAAEIERDLIRARTKSALATLKAGGRTLGRPKGTGGKTKIDCKGQEIARLLDAGVAQHAIARLLGVSRGTVYRFVKNLGGASA